MPILFNSRERDAAAAGAAERRQEPDRRTRMVRALVYGSFRPRRRGPRRSGEQHGLGAVDWHHPWWLAVALLIVLLCAADGVLTVVLIGRGAYEANPLLAPLIQGSGVTFAVVKLGLTGAGVVLLTLLSRVKAFGRLPVAVLLYGVLIGYGVLILYELRLLGVA